MNYDTFDSDAPNTTDEEYAAFVEWLSERTANELRQAEGDRDKWKIALSRYWKLGYRANLTPGELIDFLGVDAGCIIERAGFAYDAEEGDEIMAISDALTPDEISPDALK